MRTRRLLLLMVLGVVLILAAVAASKLIGPAVVDLPGARRDVLAVIYSGDGGWTGIDRGMASGLVDRGATVMGVDSLKYFRQPRTAQGAADDLARLVRARESDARPRRLILAGYSFGADALPVIVRDLPLDVRRQVAAVVLVAPGERGDLVLRPAAWWGGHTDRAYALAPVVSMLTGVRLTCVYGLAERHDACPAFPAIVRKIALPGGHHFNGDSRAVGRILAAAAGLASPPA